MSVATLAVWLDCVNLHLKCPFIALHCPSLQRSGEKQDCVDFHLPWCSRVEKSPARLCRLAAGSSAPHCRPTPLSQLTPSSLQSYPTPILDFLHYFTTFDNMTLSGEPCNLLLTCLTPISLLNFTTHYTHHKCCL